ncbi:MAG: hypothetical protein AAGH89_04670 [Verrucomicrobiota bacterium]
MARLLDFQPCCHGATATFELLPGHSLDRIVKETNGLTNTAWCEFAQQLLDLCESVHDLDGIEIHLDPRSLYLWQNESKQVSIGCATCEFRSDQTLESNFWVHSLRALSVVWYYMATGSWETYHQLTKRDLAEVQQLADQPEILEFFELLFHEDVEQRVFDRQQIRDYLDACEQQLSHQSIPVSLLRRLNSLPAQRPCLDWLPSEQQLPSKYCVSVTGRDARQPTIVPAIDEIANRPVSLHLLPPPHSIDKKLRQFCLQSKQWMRNPDGDLPILPLRDQWKTGDCITFVEAFPNGLSLAQILSQSGGGLRFPTVIEVLRKVDRALHQIERKGYEIPSIDPTSVFLVAADGKWIDASDLSWIEDPAHYTIKLRILPTRFLHGNDPAAYGADTKSQVLHEILGTTPEAGFSELAGRLLSRRELALDAVKQILRRSNKSNLRTPASLRTALINDLERYKQNPNTKSKSAMGALCDHAFWRNNTPISTQRAAFGIAAGLSLITLAFLITAIHLSKSKPEITIVETENHEIYRGGDGTDPRLAEPPTNLTPVIGIRSPRPHKGTIER